MTLAILSFQGVAAGWNDDKLDQRYSRFSLLHFLFSLDHFPIPSWTAQLMMPIPANIPKENGNKRLSSFEKIQIATITTVNVKRYKTIVFRLLLSDIL